MHDLLTYTGAPFYTELNYRLFYSVLQIFIISYIIVYVRIYIRNFERICNFFQRRIEKSFQKKKIGIR